MLQASDFEHIPVLLYPTVDALNVRPGGIYVDCTAGGGSHSAEIARRMMSFFIPPIANAFSILSANDVIRKLYP